MPPTRTTAPQLPAIGWSTVPDHLRATAGAALEEGTGVVLWLAAAEGDDCLAVAASRPFGKGAYATPVIELAALALGLGADRLAVAVTARAWSTLDPVPPVSAAGDLRQRVLSLHLAEPRVAPATGVTVRSVLQPFDLVQGAVRWGGQVSQDAAAEGWLPGALAVIVEQGDRTGVARAEVRSQLRRCTRLGHDVRLTPAGRDRLERVTAGRG